MQTFPKILLLLPQHFIKESGARKRKGEPIVKAESMASMASRQGKELFNTGMNLCSVSSVNGACIVRFCCPLSRADGACSCMSLVYYILLRLVAVWPDGSGGTAADTRK